MADKNIFQPDGSSRRWTDIGGGQYVPATILVDTSGVVQGSAANPLNYRQKQLRTNLAIHRSAITAADKLAVPTALTAADVATGGSLNFNTTYKANISANTLLGPTGCPTAASQATANDASATHVVRLTTVQVAHAISYDVFLSTDAAPLWVARITETQRAAGCTVTAVGTVSATSPGANTVDVRVVGTGVASTATPFAFNNAFDITGVTPINCAGYTTAMVQVRLTVTDFRSAPTFGYVVLGQLQQTGTDWVPITTSLPTLLAAARAPLAGYQALNLFGATQLMVLVDTMAGQGTSADIFVDLV